MGKKKLKVVYLFILFSFILSGCTNLQYVNNYSTSSLESIQKFEELNSSFNQSCLDKCEERKIEALTIAQEECSCKENEKADSITLLIYYAVRGYFDGLTNLSNGDLTNYQMDTLNNALTDGQFGDVKFDKTQVDACSNIVKIILKSGTDHYRGKKIKAYVKEANFPIKVLINFLDFNLSENLYAKLDVQKERITSSCFDITKNNKYTIAEKRDVVENYYKQLASIEAKQKELLTYSKALKIIAIGHQNLSDNIDKLKEDDIKQELTQYASKIKDIIAEYNKIKH